MKYWQQQQHCLCRLQVDRRTLADIRNPTLKSRVDPDLDNRLSQLWSDYQQEQERRIEAARQRQAMIQVGAPRACGSTVYFQRDDMLGTLS